MPLRPRLSLFAIDDRLAVRANKKAAALRTACAVSGQRRC
jgi:hypothetical protein